MPLDSYEFYAVNLVSGAVLDVLDPVSASWERRLNEPGSATLSFHVRQFDRRLVEPDLAAVYVVRNSVPVFGGYVTGLAVDGERRTAQVGLTELTGYLARRVPRRDYTFTQERQVDIAAAIVDESNVLGTGIGLVPEVREPADLAPLRDRTYPRREFKTLLELLDSLVGVIGGLDYRLDLRYEESSDTYQRVVLLSDDLHRDLALTWRAGVDRGTWAVETQVEDHANYVVATGEGQDDDLLWEAVWADLIPGGYPRFDRVTAYRSVTRRATLREHAEGDLAASLPVLDVPRIDVAISDFAPTPNAALPGDTVVVEVDDGIGQFAGRARILSTNITWDRGSPARAAVGLAPLPLSGVETDSESGGQGAALLAGTVTPQALAGSGSTAAAPAPRPQALQRLLRALDERVATLEHEPNGGGGIVGPEGPEGPPGPPGPAGGAVLSGFWEYATQTTGPAATGEVRTSFSGGTSLSDTGTVWLHEVDADGLDWSLVTINPGDTLYLRDSDGGSLTLAVDSVTPSGSQTELGVTVEGGTATTPKKNERVQVSLARAPTPVGLDTRLWVPAVLLQPQFSTGLISNTSAGRADVKALAPGTSFLTASVHLSPQYPVGGSWAVTLAYTTAGTSAVNTGVRYTTMNGSGADLNTDDVSLNQTVPGDGSDTNKREALLASGLAWGPGDLVALRVGRRSGDSNAQSLNVLGVWLDFTP